MVALTCVILGSICDPVQVFSSTNTVPAFPKIRLLSIPFGRHLGVDLVVNQPIVCSGSRSRFVNFRCVMDGTNFLCTLKGQGPTPSLAHFWLLTTYQ